MHSTSHSSILMRNFVPKEQKNKAISLLLQSLKIGGKLRNHSKYLSDRMNEGYDFKCKLFQYSLWVQSAMAIQNKEKCHCLFQTVFV